MGNPHEALDVQLSQMGILPIRTQANNSYSGAALGEVLRKEGAQLLFKRSGGVVDDAALKGTDLAYVGLCCVGEESVSPDDAFSAGVTYQNAPGANTNSVVENVEAALGLLARGGHVTNAAVLAGRFPKDAGEEPDLYEAREVEGSAAGLIGFGNVGSALARRLLAKGVRVGFYDPDPYFDDPRNVPSGIWRFRSIEELMRGSDIVSVHASFRDPHGKKNDGILTARSFEHFAEEAELADGKEPLKWALNFARAPLLRVEEARDAFHAGHLRRGAFDVYDHEPKTAAERGNWHPAFLSDHEFTRAFVWSPHNSASTREGQFKVSKVAGQVFDRFLNSGELSTVYHNHMLVGSRDPRRVPFQLDRSHAGLGRLFIVHRNKRGTSGAILGAVSKELSGNVPENKGTDWIDTRGPIGFGTTLLALDANGHSASLTVDNLQNFVRSINSEKVLEPFVRFGGSLQEHRFNFYFSTLIKFS
ncbi:hypothetical protein IPG41_01405 [Candidatus Peregrinibacteria bacterium]|nr:MAG: hypothetical protein IPG41_01405 [Candidatus Peregrinibacteria bacterium]